MERRCVDRPIWERWPEGRQVLPVLAALFMATLAGMFLLTAKVAWTGRLRDLYLAWNLILALMPLGLAFLCLRWKPWGVGADGFERSASLLVCSGSRLGSPRNSRPGGLRYRVGRLLCNNASLRGMANSWKFVGTATAWLLFFPNAPYIFTDMIHLGPTWRTMYWVDLVLILLFALTGFVAGFLSLYLMQAVVRERAGHIGGWLFVLGMAILSGAGVFVGRFLRWNTWDVLLRPWTLVREGFGVVTGGEHFVLGVVFPLLFGIFFFTAYALLYSLTHLTPGMPRR